MGRKWEGFPQENPMASGFKPSLFSLTYLPLIITAGIRVHIVDFSRSLTFGDYPT